VRPGAARVLDRRQGAQFALDGRVAAEADAQAVSGFGALQFGAGPKQRPAVLLSGEVGTAQHAGDLDGCVAHCSSFIGLGFSAIVPLQVDLKSR
jgi:hypothetical protein